MPSWVVVQNIYSKMHLVSCTNTHRDVTYLVNHGMVKNIKSWISWERNIIFLGNKKFLSLCLRWHIWRSYCFVAEVTFKVSGNSHRYGTCWSVTKYLNIPIFRNQKYGYFSIRASAIRSWNYAQDMLKTNLSLKNSTPKSIKYFLSKYFIESY